MKEVLKSLFPALSRDIEEWWNDDCRSAGLLGAFDRVYGPGHPDRDLFIRLLELEPDKWTSQMGVSSIDIADPQKNN